MNFFKTMGEMSQAVDAVSSPAVAVWLNWMAAMFLLSLLFVWKYKPARVVLFSTIISLIVSVLIFDFTKNPHLLGISHLTVWGPLLIYLVKKIKQSEIKLKSFYGVWVVTLSLTISISLVFDVLDITLVLLGKKN